MTRPVNTKAMPLHELQDFLNTNSIPFTERHTGFLEIIRKQHHQKHHAAIRNWLSQFHVKHFEVSYQYQ